MQEISKDIRVSQINAVKSVSVEISVVLGRAEIPMHQLLKMGRGAVIELAAHQDDEVWVLANNEPIARAEIVVRGDKIAICITDTVNDYFE